MTTSRYALNGHHAVVRYDADHYTVRLSVLCDRPECGDMIDLDVWARVCSESGRLDVYRVESADVAIDGIPADIHEWAARASIEDVCHELRMDDLAAQCPS